MARSLPPSQSKWHLPRTISPRRLRYPKTGDARSLRKRKSQSLSLCRSSLRSPSNQLRIPVRSLPSRPNSSTNNNSKLNSCYNSNRSLPFRRSKMPPTPSSRTWIMLNCRLFSNSIPLSRYLMSRGNKWSCTVPSRTCSSNRCCSSSNKRPPLRTSPWLLPRCQQNKCSS